MPLVGFSIFRFFETYFIVFWEVLKMANSEMISFRFQVYLWDDPTVSRNRLKWNLSVEIPLEWSGISILRRIKPGVSIICSDISSWMFHCFLFILFSLHSSYPCSSFFHLLMGRSSPPFAKSQYLWLVGCSTEAKCGSFLGEGCWLFSEHSVPFSGCQVKALQVKGLQTHVFLWFHVFYLMCFFAALTYFEIHLSRKHGTFEP